MRDAGQKLKEARLAKGLSLNDVATLTKIRSSYLQAIEEGDLKKIPGSVYAKGFIKVYANTLGLNPSEILSEFQIDPATPQPMPEVQEIKGIKPTKPRNTGKIVVISVVILILLIAAMFIIFLGSTLKNKTIPQLREPEPTQTQEKVESIPTEQNNENQVSVGENLPLPTEMTDAKPSDNPTGNVVDGLVDMDTQNPGSQLATDVNPSQGNVTPVTETPADSLKKIQLIANDRSWVRVQVDDQIIFSGDMNKGETKRFEGKKIQLRIGNASAIQVNYNNEILGPFGVKEQVVDRTF